jgi:hypothetical protein
MLGANTPLKISSIIAGMLGCFGLLAGGGQAAPVANALTAQYFW